MAEIDKMQPRTGRVLKEDGTWVNEADGLNADGSRNVNVKGSNLKDADVITVTTAGTAEQLPDVECMEVTVHALKSNTGSIYVGKSTVSDTSFGVELSANEAETFRVSNANELWIDASVSGEGVSYVAI